MRMMTIKKKCLKIFYSSVVPIYKKNVNLFMNSKLGVWTLILYISK